MENSSPTKNTDSESSTLTNFSLIASRVQMLIDMVVILEGRYQDDDNTITEKCLDLFTGVASVRESSNLVKEYLLQTRKQISAMEKSVEKLNSLKEHIAHMSNQLPKFVTEAASEGKDFSVVDSSSIANLYMHSQNGVCSTPIDFTKLTSPEPNGVTQGLSNRAKNTDDVPTIPYVTDEEVNKVPKYMRGRLSAEVINKLIDSFNDTYKKKYEMIKKPKKSIKPKDLDYYYDLKKAENMEPKGTFFITVKDLNTFGNIKMDKISLNIVTILRHLKRIRENRHTNNNVHYIVS